MVVQVGANSYGADRQAGGGEARGVGARGLAAAAFAVRHFHTAISASGLRTRSGTRGSGAG